MEPEHRRYPGSGGAPAAVAEPGVPLADRYQLGTVLGRGGMSEVRDGWDLKLGRPVAIKLLACGNRPEDRLRFETEARATATLSSHHIVVVHDVGEHDGLPFIVMERLPGISLADHIARGPLTPDFVRSVLEDVLDALAVAHAAGIVHRDVKPGNVLFTPKGEAKLADFGIAKTNGGVHTMTGEIVGSMAYLSPARLTAKPATPADDLYALGVVGYEALTGRRPFPQTELGPLGHAILHESPAPLIALRPDVPAGLADVIERAMAREPARKFEQAEAMRTALAGAKASPKVRNPTRAITAPLPSLGTHAFVAAEPEPPHSRRKLWAAAIAATFLMSVMLIAIIPSFSAPPPSPVGTSTPLPPPPATSEVAPMSTPAPPPAPPPGRHGKKNKGGKGD
ncbi:serine/threonine-protein kinase [Mycobacterium asiaticum]|nr:serine/threonine-protein kinase [Mycobacterium asiaticum]